MSESIGCVLSIGNFDGVHLGHQKLIQTALAGARSEGLRCIIMTLEPHPLKVLFPERQMNSILELGQRVELIKGCGVDEVEVLDFSRDVSNLSPEDFFKQYIVNKFHTKHLVVGYDFNFGKDRKGTLDVAKKLCEKNNIKFTVVEEFKIDQEIVSSSKIRNFIVNGQIEKASEFLGRPFYLTGMIEKGVGRGKTIGFPTANLFSKNMLFPLKGVYITLIELNNIKLPSVTNVGDNPTFTDVAAKIKIETHILNFKNDIYGEKVKIYFLKRLRDEKKFSSVQELVAQIKLDVLTAKQVFGV